MMTCSGIPQLFTSCASSAGAFFLRKSATERITPESHAEKLKSQIKLLRENQAICKRKIEEHRKRLYKRDGTKDPYIEMILRDLLEYHKKTRLAIGRLVQQQENIHDTKTRVGELQLSAETLQILNASSKEMTKIMSAVGTREEIEQITDNITDVFEQSQEILDAVSSPSIYSPSSSSASRLGIPVSSMEDDLETQLNDVLGQTEDDPFMQSTDPTVTPQVPLSPRRDHTSPYSVPSMHPTAVPVSIPL